MRNVYSQAHTVLPVSCVSPFDYITCQPAVDGACPTRSCKYTATRCTYVPNMPLQTLLLSGYDLTILPETFGHTMSVLERLHLNDNQLTQLPDGFGTGMVSLKHLYLHNNQLDSLPTGFGAQMVSLQHLNLGANKLTSAAITDAALALPESLRKLHLEVDTLGDTCTAKMSIECSNTREIIPGTFVLNNPNSIFCFLSFMTELKSGGFLKVEN